MPLAGYLTLFVVHGYMLRSVNRTLAELAITLESSPHCSQIDTSMLNTRLRRCAQVMDR
ncbi:MAG: hypothetical protein ABW127_03075 [Candidatus Thiodiazotropha endolucinida]